MSYLAAATVGLVALTTQAGGATGYLPAVGPAPLRFQELVSVAPFALPPLQMHDPEPPAVEAAPTKSAPSAANTTPAVEPPVAASALPTLSPKTVPTATDTNAVNVVEPLQIPLLIPLPMPTPPDASAPAILSPQMLLHFFNQQNSTNRASTLVTPVEFSPARPSTLPSSTSTYIVSPPKSP